MRPVSWRRSTIWRGVPLVAEDQDREEGDRDQHRQRAPAARRQQDRGGAGAGGDQHAGAGEELAQGADPAASRLAARAPQAGLPAWRRRCRRITPGVTSVRSSPSSFTRSL